MLFIIELFSSSSSLINHEKCSIRLFRLVLFSMSLTKGYLYVKRYKLIVSITIKIILGIVGGVQMLPLHSYSFACTIITICTRSAFSQSRYNFTIILKII